MAITPENAPDSLIEKLFGDDLKAAEATAKAMDRIEDLMRPAFNAETIMNGRRNEIDLRGRDIRYEYHGMFRGKQYWTCWDNYSYDGDESHMGNGESKEMALVDLMDKMPPELSPRMVYPTIYPGSGEEPADYGDPVRVPDPDEPQ